MNGEILEIDLTILVGDKGRITRCNTGPAVEGPGADELWRILNRLRKRLVPGPYVLRASMQRGRRGFQWIIQCPSDGFASAEVLLSRCRVWLRKTVRELVNGMAQLPHNDEIGRVVQEAALAVLDQVAILHTDDGEGIRGAFLVFREWQASLFEIEIVATAPDVLEDTAWRLGRGAAVLEVGETGGILMIGCFGRNHPFRKHLHAALLERARKIFVATKRLILEAFRKDLCDEAEMLIELAERVGTLLPSIEPTSGKGDGGGSGPSFTEN